MQLTHFDAEGKARMVDVTEKKETVREATATGKIKVSRDVYDAIEAGTVGKGDVLSVATTAGIMGVKRTADLIPMCHIPSDRYVQNPLPSTRNIFHSFCRLFLLSGQTYPQSPHWKMRISFPPDEEMSGKAV